MRQRLVTAMSPDRANVAPLSSSVRHMCGGRDHRADRRPDETRGALDHAQTGASPRHTSGAAVPAVGTARGVRALSP